MIQPLKKFRSKFLAKVREISVADRVLTELEASGERPLIFR